MSGILHYQAVQNDIQLSFVPYKSATTLGIAGETQVRSLNQALI